MSLIVPNRRRFLAGMIATLMAPAIVKATSIMLVSSINLPKMRYIIAEGFGAGEIVEIAGSPLAHMFPCDGSLVNGLRSPSLFAAVRGRAPGGDDDWIHLPHYDEHSLNVIPTIDRFYSLAPLEDTNGPHYLTA